MHQNQRIIKAKLTVGSDARGSEFHMTWKSFPTVEIWVQPEKVWGPLFVGSSNKHELATPVVEL